MISAIKKWFLRTFRGPITVTQAKSMGLEFVRNVSGDEINQMGCRSIWSDKGGNSYRVADMYDPLNNRPVGKFFYRIGHSDSGNGLWYDRDGNWTGLAIDKYQLQSNQIPMGFDKNIQGWISVTDSVDDLYKWFTREEMGVLANHGYEVICFWLDFYDNRYKKYKVPGTDVEHWLVHTSCEQLFRFPLSRIRY